ncbi:MAG: arylsulfatase [Verrucomicrobia bacterium]|nr:arylsulfatase [Verrucomicrobiota bacterium]
MKHFTSFLVSLCLFAGHAITAEPEKPNIVFILADDLGRTDVGFMGCKEIRTPQLDKLAAAGAVLDAHYVQPVCSPTRAALMTGRYATHTGVYTIVRPHAPWGLPLEERTLAQALRAAGYETAITGKWHLGEFEEAYRPTRRGFDHQYGFWFGMIDYFKHTRDTTLDWHRNDQPCNDEGYSTHLIAKEACRRVREKQPDKPLFLYLPFNAVHGPFQVPDSYLAPYDKLTGTRRTYAGMVLAMDEAVGQVVAALEEKKLKENTLIVFSSDNGGPSPGRITTNGPLRAGKGTIYEGGIRVCAFASWPGRIPAGTIKEPIHAVDWYPTLVKLAGGKLEQKLPLDGLDIWPVLTQGTKSPHDALLLCGGRPEQAAIRMGDWKLLSNASEVDAEKSEGKTAGKRARGKAARVTHGVELYNLADDIGEKKNLADAQPEKVKELRAKLDALLKNAVPSGVVQAATATAKPKRRQQK